jgi:hypothetical protein
MSNGLVRFAAASASATALLVFGLNGTASAPPASAPVRIVDGDNASLAAHVDAGGNLQVGGTVGIDSSTPVSVSSSDDAGRRAFEVGGFSPWLDGFHADMGFTVPEGQRLVIEFVSFDAHTETGLNIQAFTVETAQTYMVVPTKTLTPGPVRVIASQAMRLYADGGSRVRLTGTLTESGTGAGGMFASLSGYLIDCSAAACS